MIKGAGEASGSSWSRKEIHSIRSRFCSLVASAGFSSLACLRLASLSAEHGPRWCRCCHPCCWSEPRPGLASKQGAWGRAGRVSHPGLPQIWLCGCEGIPWIGDSRKREREKEKNGCFKRVDVWRQLFAGAKTVTFAAFVPLRGRCVSPLGYLRLQPQPAEDWRTWFFKPRWLRRFPLPCSIRREAIFLSLPLRSWWITRYSTGAA